MAVLFDGMRTYVDLSFSSDGTIATVVADRIREIARVSLITGEHDIVFEWETVEEFQERLRAIHNALAGTHATYRVQTVSGSEDGLPAVAWPPGLREVPEEHPGYRRRGPSP